MPTLVTLGNLIAGFAAIHYASKPIDSTSLWNWPTLTVAGALIFLGMFFDAIDGEWFVNGLFNYRGEAEVPGDSDGRLTADDYYVLDLVTGFRNEHWTATVFVKNVFDDAEVITKRAAGTDYNDLSIIPPRTTGITLSYRF